MLSTVEGRAKLMAAHDATAFNPCCWRKSGDDHQVELCSMYPVLYPYYHWKKRRLSFTVKLAVHLNLGQSFITKIPGVSYTITMHQVLLSYTHSTLRKPKKVPIERPIKLRDDCFHRYILTSEELL